MVRSVFSPIKFFASATDSIVTSLRDPAGLVAVGAGRGVFVATPVAAWVGVELGVSPAPQPDNNKPKTTIQMTTINLICFLFMFLLSLPQAYELMKAFQPTNDLRYHPRSVVEWDNFPEGELPEGWTPRMNFPR